MPTPFRGLALCAGVGGLELGLELARPDYRTVAYVEWSKPAQAVLRARMRDGCLHRAPIYDDVRRFVKGEAGLSGAVATRMAGSPDLYRDNGRCPLHSINFITSHDGFTLADLVAYDRKHNEANGEQGRDGADENDSWNCGWEGDGAPIHVERLRGQQARNLMAILFLSQGVPMILAGDEHGRTQRGNNNAYAQDNEIT